MSNTNIYHIACCHILQQEVIFYSIISHAMEEPKKFSLNTTDLKKIGKWALVAIIWVLLTYFADLIPNIDFGVYTPVVVWLFSILVNIARKRIEWQE